MNMVAGARERDVIIIRVGNGMADTPPGAVPPTGTVTGRLCTTPYLHITFVCLFVGFSYLSESTMLSVSAHKINSTFQTLKTINTLRTGSFKLFKRPFPGFLTILNL
jgi:hypothetical protein